MTDDDILRMAREAGGTWEYRRTFPVACVMYDDELVKFARLISAKEREGCAKVVEQYCGAWNDQGFALAQAIRERGKK